MSLCLPWALTSLTVIPAMIQFKWVEKEEEKDFYRLRHCEWFFARWQKFCTQPQLCWCHATEDSYNELKFTNKNAEWERKYQYDYYAGIPYQRQSHGNWTKILFKRTLFTCWFCFFVLSLINTNAIEKPVSTVWSNLMKKKYGSVDSYINDRRPW